MDDDYKKTVKNQYKKDINFLVKFYILTFFVLLDSIMMGALSSIENNSPLFLVSSIGMIITILNMFVFMGFYLKNRSVKNQSDALFNTKNKQNKK